ncbi:MAG: type II secretion system F family protein [Candidatus Aenigmarchaeota archaeon]|nr:type II secretion system F family protein [Candidatus Aenigmarchaeota archaeon]
MSYVDLSYKIFGNLSKASKNYFIDIKEDLQRANINYTLEEYVSLALFTTVITFIIEAVLLSFTFGLFTDAIFAALLAVTLSFFFSSLLLFLFYTYPFTASKDRDSKISRILPFAVSYMATIASARTPMVTIFKTISHFKEFGEVAKESKNIVQNIELFGMTASSSLKRQARRTPSKELSDLLWSMNVILASGGDMTGFLQNKSKELMADYQRRIRKYSQDLSLYVEIYLTLLITGSIFFIVLSSIISTISGGFDMILAQSFVVFAVLPFISIIFILIIKSLSPVG